MSKKITSVMLALVMICLSFTPINFGIFEIKVNASGENLFSTADTKISKITEANGKIHETDLLVWDGKTKTAPSAGNGSVDNPYQISNANELAWYANKVNTGNSSSNNSNRKLCAKLVNDIDLGGHNWYSFRIGQSWYFAGTFDGQGYTIYNLYTETDTNNQGGLFGNAGLTSSPALIKNIKFVNAKAVSGYSGASMGTGRTSIVCGSLFYPGSTIENVSVSGTITLAEENCNVIAAGSIAGHCDRGTIRNCYSDVTIDLTKSKNMRTSFAYGADNSLKEGTGGIVGTWMSSSESGSYIENCTFAGKIDAPQSSRVGGIVGSLHSNDYYHLNNCSNEGDIIGYRQVAGIIGWAYNGSGAKVAPKGLYNTGNITAKTATKSYAAGIANGFKGDVLGNYSYSTGNVSVDETISGVKQDDFNVACGLLYTTTVGSGEANWDNVYAAYNSAYKKAPLSTGTVQTETAANISAFSEEDFKNGTVCTKLNEKTDDTVWKNVSGLNSGCPISEVLHTANLFAPNNYYLDNSSLDFTVKGSGYVYFGITPVEDAVTVSIGLDETSVSTKRNCRFLISNPENTLSVQGKAYITKNLQEQSEPRILSELSATPIKVSFPDSEPRAVMIALYKDKALASFKHYPEVKPIVSDDKSTISATIDLTDLETEGCTLKAYLWEPDTANPVREVAILGDYDGPVATVEEKALAVTSVLESYLAKGRAVQYDETALTDDGLMHAELGSKSPEDYTLQSVYYTDNSAFIYDVYKEALGISLEEETLNSSEIRISESETSSLNPSDFTADLEDGDLVILKNDDSNHQMIYAGEGEFIHAVGESYDLASLTDNYEENGAIEKISASEISTIISDYNTATVYRPTKIEDLVLPQNSANRINNMQYIVAQKTASCDETTPVQPGENVTFTFTIENKGDTEKTLSVRDTIPAYTKLIRGCDDANGLNLSWIVNVPAGEIKTVSYTVKVADDKTKIGEYIESYSTVGGVSVNCPRILIGRIFNETDEERVTTAIHAMNDSEFEGANLAKKIYSVSHTRSFTLSGTASEILDSIYVSGGGSSTGSGATGEEVAESATDLVKITVPTMFGGRKVSSSAERMFKTMRARRIYEDSILSGDILIAQKDVTDADSAKMYMYNGKYMMELSFKGMKKEETDALLNALPSYDRYVVLRPSIAISNLNNFAEEVDENLSDEQIAVVETAKAYLLRGARMQYDDTGFTPGYEYRWQKKLKHPEDYTKDEWGYSNCAAFTYDTYYHALGFDIGMYTTDQLRADNNKSASAKMTVYSFMKTGNETDEEKAVVRNEILSTLKAGDIVVVKRESGSGHALLYAGNGTILHSGGGNYSYNDSTETYEPTVRFKNVDDFFMDGDSCNPFGIVEYFGILRPINKWTKGIPENTQNRVLNMKGVRAEKISSHKSSVTVNPGEEMTFTFSVFNSNDTAVTVDIKDTVPENATYVSGASNLNASEVSWRITIEPQETKEVSYTIRINDNAEIGTYVKCNMGTVGGVMVKCPDVLIKKTLTETEKQTLIASINKFKNDSARTLTYVDLANAIYKDAFGVENILPDTDGNGTFELTDVESGVYTATTSPANLFKVDPNGAYYDLIAPTLYGGRKFYQTSAVPTRTRLARPHHLVCGDILLAKTLSATYLYIYDGEKYINLSSMGEVNAAKRMENVLAYGNYYAVLRPSFIME